MVKNNQVFSLIIVRSKAELLAYFSVAAWPLCAAFQLGELLFAVTRQTAPGAPEFAVIRNGQQIETLALGRLSRLQVSTRLDDLLTGGGTWLDDVKLSLEPASVHRCSKCHHQLAASA